MTRARVAGGVAALTVACAGCGWIIPDDRDASDAERIFRSEREDTFCQPNIDTVRHVVDIDDPAGGPHHEWWTARTEDGGRSEIVVQFFPDGGSSAVSHCFSAGDTDAEITYWGGAMTATAVMQVGRAPESASEVVLHFDTGSVHIDVLSDGAFIEFVPVEPGTVGALELIEALDDDGNVIASTNRPMG